MPVDPHVNFAISTVATAPSPATSGTSLIVAAGEGVRFGSLFSFNATVWPVGTIPTPLNSEIVRVSARSTDTLTIARAQEGTTARTIVVGDQIAMTITRKTLADVETANDIQLRYFRERLAIAETAPLRMMFVGDSIVEGLGLTVLADRFIHKVKDDIALAAGVSAGNGGSHPGRYTATANSFGMTGDNGTFGDDGLGRRSWLSASGSTNFREWPSTVCDRVNIFYNRGSGVGAFEVRIDGTLVATVDAYQAAAGPTATVWDSGALTQGAKVVRVTTINTGSAKPAPTFSQNIAGMMPFLGNYTTGVQLWAAGRSTMPTWVPLAPELGHVTLVNPDVVFICTGVNDPDFGLTVDQTKQRFIDAAAAYDGAIPGTPSFVFVAMWEYPDADSDAPVVPFEPYVLAIRDAAAAAGAAFVNIYDGLGTPAASLVNAVSSLHPNAAGSRAMADIVASRLDIKAPLRAIDVQIFTSSSAWHRPAGATLVRAMVFSAGCGGGTGRRGAAGAIRGGAGGGTGGGFSDVTFLAADIDDTVTVTIPAGSAGGAAPTADNTNGNAGATMPTGTSFGTLVSVSNFFTVGGGSAGTGVAYDAGRTTGGGAGAAAALGGTDISTSGGVGGDGTLAGSIGGLGANAGGAGGGGGGVTAATPGVSQSGQPGGVGSNGAVAGGAFALPDVIGQDGAASSRRRGGGGGGGSGASNSIGSKRGGDGGLYGAGGGGTGGGTNGATGGRGGNGSAGIILVVTYR